MGWNAKPSGAYAVGSDEWKENIDEAYAQLGGTWALEALCGMLGNMQHESGMNPWRWQSDAVSLTDRYKGYGLPQFTPAYGYINDYGKGVDGYAPNLSVSKVTEGASPSDGRAQLIVIDTDKAGKFLNRTKYCDYANIRDYYPMSAYKQGKDLWLATVAWLYHYEFPAAQYRTYAAAQGRYKYSLQVFEYLNTGEHPEPDPDPDPGPDPQPGVKRAKMPIYLYPNYRRRKLYG